MERKPMNSSPKPPNGVRPKILVVDDEADVVRSTRMLLNQLGYDCLGLTDAALVTDTAAAERPDLILQDVIMPGLNIADLLQRLQRNAATARIPVVLFSAAEQLPEIAAEYDAAGFLQKPFSEQSLVEVLAHAMGQKAIHEAVPPPRITPGLPEEVREGQRQAIKDYFHSYWNALTALNNYTEFLLRSPAMGEMEIGAVKEMQRLLLQLERSTDALRGQLLQFVG